ncbi:hypothetical protein BsWGS_06312 [Bradybaena similaris]
MAACSLFEEDEVCVYKPGKGYSFGLVLENSEFLSSGEEDDADPLNDRLSKGTVRVSWFPSGKETVVSEDKVQLLDRSLMPGDVVKRLIPGQESQCGFIMDMDVHCHLRILKTNKYIYSVNSKDLKPLQKFEYGQEVLYDLWLGRVEGFEIQVVLLFPDGARCVIDESELCSFRDVMEKRSTSEFSECPFYPGQELKGHLDSLTDAKWIVATPRHCHRTTSKKGKSSTVVVKVEKIVYRSVEVHWLYRGFEKSDHVNEALRPPPNVIEGMSVERLKILDWFSHCSVQIGDYMTHCIKNDDIITSIEPSKAYDPKTACIKDVTVKVVRDSDNKKQDETVANSVTSGTSIERETDDGDDADFEDVDDGDKSGLHEKNGASGGGGRGTGGGGHGGRKRSKVVKSLGQRHKSGKQSHGQKSNSKKRVIKECSFKPDEVVQVEVEFTTSWATVMWQDGTVEKDIPSMELFPVHHLDDLEFFPGDFVLSTVDLPEPADYGVVVKADHAERTCLVHWMKTYEVDKATAPTVVASNCEVSVYDITDHPDYKFRPGQSIVRVGGFEHLAAEPGVTLQAVGQIFEMDANGHLVVKWADGSISQCYPQEVYIISEDMDDVSDNSDESWASESEYDTDGSGEIWETESENEIIGGDSDDKGGKDDIGVEQGALCEHKQKLDALLSRAEVALVRLQKLLNVFDISAVSVPECFHDIIRIYRSCHDLDNILQSTFFSDPELQSLISQAKKEIRRDKANKISKHLSQLFEAWSSSLPPEDGENVGTVAIGGKTIRVSAKRKAADIEVSLQVPTGEVDSCDSSRSQLKSGAAGGSEVSEGSNVSMLIHDSPAVSDLINACDALYDLKGIKELSEAAVSDCSRSGPNERRSSDPSSISAAFKNKKKNKDANLVGENCVSKAAKRTKSDGFDDSGHEAKKSRDETMTANHVAQDLCYKICESLQKQILKIHEEVNKRTRRLINVTVKQIVASENDVSKDVSLQTSPVSNSGETVGCNHNEGSDVSKAAEHDEKGYVNKDKNPSTSISSPPCPEVNDTAPAVCHNKEKPLENEQLTLTDNNAAIDEKSTNSGDLLLAKAEVCEALSSNSCISQKDETSETPEDVKGMQDPCKGFSMFGEAQSFHTYISRESQPANPRVFKTAVRKELKLFQTSLPDGIFIKGFEDRLDLYSFMILGPAGTPYEDGLFLFDMMLPNDYPNAPPLCHYHSYCSDRLNPNLYEDGKVCVSLLGTWAGKGTEVWTSKSNLLQVLVSIQGLILVPEPYYNEAGYERQRGTQVGQENSRMYNEMAILKTVQSLTKMCQNLPTLFKEEIYQYIKIHGPRMISRLRCWMSLNELKKKQPTDGCSSTQTKEKQPLPQDINSDAPLQETIEHSKHGELSPAHGADVTDHIQNGIEDSSKLEQAIGADCRADNSAQAEQTGPTEPHVQPSDDQRISDPESSDTGRLAGTLNGHSVAPVNDGESSVTASLTVLEAAAHLQEESSAAVQCSTDNKQQENKYREISNVFSDQDAHNLKMSGQPEFTLFPMSRGFCLTLHKFLNIYEKAVQKMETPTSSSESL